MAEMGPIDERDTAFEALYREVRERATELGEKRGMTEELLQNVLENVTEPGRFADLVAGYIDLPVPERQSLLETLAVEERLRRVLVHVQREIGMLDAQAEIKTQVQEELGKRQREMYLREQLKAIQKELGDEDEPSRELAELREKIAGLDLPKEVRAEVERELGRLGRSGASRWTPRSSGPTSNGSRSSPGARDRTMTWTSRGRSGSSTRTTTA